jgi:hypothetical protein
MAGAVAIHELFGVLGVLGDPTYISLLQQQIELLVNKDPSEKGITNLMAQIWPSLLQQNVKPAWQVRILLISFIIIIIIIIIIIFHPNTPSKCWRNYRRPLLTGTTKYVGIYLVVCSS